MASVEITKDLFAHHNPLKFKSHPQGKRLYWANRRWRSEQKGWGQLRPVRTTDSDWPEIEKCLAEAPLDLDLQGDSLIRRGDLLLCVKSQEAYEANQKRRSYFANRKIEALRQGKINPVEEELSRVRGEPGSEYLIADRPDFKHEGRSVPAIKSGVARQAR